MRIQGLQKLTLLDYPGKTACTVFLSGCNFRCPFCHNAPLLAAAGEDGMDDLPDDAAEFAAEFAARREAEGQREPKPETPGAEEHRA